MPFVDQIVKYRSVSIVGLEKNTGKTECLNYVLRRLSEDGPTIAVTSIGVDGEQVDRVTSTAKPEIFLKKGTIFSTNEKHYRRRRITAELLDIEDSYTNAMGRLVTAKAVTGGKILLSGPSSTTQLTRWIAEVRMSYGVDLCIVDGALSRKSHASPTVSEGMILTTGAAFSIDYSTLARHTLFIIELIGIEPTKLKTKRELADIEKGIWLIDKRGEVTELTDFTSFSETTPTISHIKDPVALFFAGALTDRFLNKITGNSDFKGVELIVNDFTKIFADRLTYKKFTANGGKLSVLKQSKLIAVCVNPVAPNGVILDSQRICDEISSKTNIPVYDIMKDGYEV